MQITLEMSPDFNRTVGELSSLGASLVRAASTGLAKGVKIAASCIVRDFLTGQALKRRTGTMARVVTGWLAEPLHGVVGIPDNSPVDRYAWLLGDERKTIVPTKSKFLTIPIGENLTAAGVAKYTSPRQVPDGFFVNTNGRLLFGRKNGKRGKFRALFLLVKSVTIQGTGALKDGVESQLDNIIADMETEIGKAIDSR